MTHRARATGTSAVGPVTTLLLVLLCTAATGCSPDNSSGDGAREERQQVASSTLGADAVASASQNSVGANRFAIVEGKATARSASQRLWASLSEGALRLWPEGDPRRWHALFKWTGVGRGAYLAAVPPPTSEPQLQGHRASYRRAEWGEEWYVNKSRGIEQGFVLWKRPPGGEEMLVLEVTVEGSLAPSLSADGSYVLLSNERGLPVLRYSHLVAFDAQGGGLPSHMRVEDGSIWLHVDDRRAQYPITVDPLIWQESMKRTGDDTTAQDRFGYSVAMSGDVAVVGAIHKAVGGVDTGAAYVFYEDNGAPGQWGQSARLTVAGGELYGMFGWSVAVDSRTAIVGAPYEDGGLGNSGAAYVFEQNRGGADNWGRTKRLTALDRAAGDVFGISVAISGNTAIVGAHSKAGNAGAAYLFNRNQGGPDNWGQVAKLTSLAPAAGDYFGSSVVIDGDTAIVGAMKESNSTGAVYVFHRNQGGPDSWGHVAKLTSVDHSVGDYFGSSLAIDGDTAIVGALRAEHGGAESGAAYLFNRNEGGADRWGQIAKIAPNDPAAGDYFGNSVDIDGDTVIVGASGKNSLSGVVYLFEKNGRGADGWGEIAKIMASDAAAEDEYGNSVAASGGWAIVGAPFGHELGNFSGAVYLLRLASAEGDGCTASAECHSGYCVDGVCCANACDGPCMACRSTLTGGMDGACALVSSGLDPHGDCNAGVSACDGQGACKLQPGQPCDSRSQCLSEHCVDEVCCDSPCNGPCEACAAAVVGGGQDGQCQYAPAGADPDGDCAPDTSNVCGADGRCNGGGQCREYASRGAPCGPSSCNSGVELPAPQCDGAGVCEELAQRKCFPFVCNADGDVCLSVCSTSKDCAADTSCTLDGMCIAGGTCRDGDTVALSDGETLECAPYTCAQETGACRERCRSTVDCVGGFICTSEGQCVPYDGQDKEEASGCGCALPGGGSSGRGWKLLLLASLALMRLKRRGRTDAT